MTILRGGKAPKRKRDEPAELPLERLLEVPLTLTVVVCGKDVRLDAVLALRPGDVIEFQKAVEESLTVEINGRPVAAGSAAKRGEKFAIKIQDIVSAPERIRAMGP